MWDLNIFVLIFLLEFLLILGSVCLQALDQCHWGATLFIVWLALSYFTFYDKSKDSFYWSSVEIKIISKFISIRVPNLPLLIYKLP